LDGFVWALSLVIVSTLPDLIGILQATQGFDKEIVYRGILADLFVAVNHTGLAPLYDFEPRHTWGPGNSISSLSFISKTDWRMPQSEL